MTDVTTEFRADALTAMGAVKPTAMKIGGRTAQINMVPVDQQQINVGAPQVALKADPNDLRRALNPTPQFTPRVALNKILHTVAQSNIPAGLRAEIINWQRRERAVRGRGGKAFTELQMKTGRAIVAKLPAPALNRIDPAQEMRFALSAQKPAGSRNEAQLNQHFRSGMQAATKRAPITANTVQTIAAPQMRPAMARTMSRNAIAAKLGGPQPQMVKGVAKTAALAKGAERAMEAILGTAPRPAAGRRKLMQLAM